MPIAPRADWEQTKLFCRSFAEAVSQEEPERFLSVLAKAERHGRILIDYLRNGLGNTAIASFCPRARPGATVAMPLSWAEVKPGLDPRAFTLQSVPELLRKRRRDPWADFREAARPIPERMSAPRTPLAPKPVSAMRSTGQAIPTIVVASKPKPRR